MSHDERSALDNKPLISFPMTEIQDKEKEIDGCMQRDETLVPHRMEEGTHASSDMRQRYDAIGLTTTQLEESMEVRSSHSSSSDSQTSSRESFTYALATERATIAELIAKKSFMEKHAAVATQIAQLKAQENLLNIEAKIEMAKARETVFQQAVAACDSELQDIQPAAVYGVQLEPKENSQSAAATSMKQSVPNTLPSAVYDMQYQQVDIQKSTAIIGSPSQPSDTSSAPVSRTEAVTEESDSHLILLSNFLRLTGILSEAERLLTGDLMEQHWRPCEIQQINQLLQRITSIINSGEVKLTHQEAELNCIQDTKQTEKDNGYMDSTVSQTSQFATEHKDKHKHLTKLKPHEAIQNIPNSPLNRSQHTENTIVQQVPVLDHKEFYSPKHRSTNDLTDYMLHTQQRMISMMLLPRPQVPIFSGDVSRYNTFIRAFDTRIAAHVDTDEDKLYYLDQHLLGEPKDLVGGCLYMDANDGYQTARKLLQTEYGNTYNISLAWKKYYHGLK